MEDIKIDMVKPVDLPQFTGPLSKLDARSNDLNVVKYPSDLGTKQRRNSKNHFVTFRIYDIEPAGIVSEGRNTAGEATLALPNAGEELSKFADLAGSIAGGALMKPKVPGLGGGLGKSIASGAIESGGNAMTMFGSGASSNPFNFQNAPSMLGLTQAYGAPPSVSSTNALSGYNFYNSNPPR